MAQENEEMPIKSPVHGFYQVTVEVATEDEKTGRPKKQKEFHLVDAVNPTDVEVKVTEAMKGTIYEWKIVNMAVSKIQFVY